MKVLICASKEEVQRYINNEHIKTLGEAAMFMLKLVSENPNQYLDENSVIIVDKHMQSFDF